MNDENIKYFETESLPLSVSIICSGIPLNSLIKDSNNKATFFFPYSQELVKITELYWQRALKIEPNQFWETQRYLKSRIYEMSI